MKRILIWYWDPFNFGDRAIAQGIITALRALIPEANLTLLSNAPEIDEREYRTYDVKVVRTPWILRFKMAGLKQIVAYFGMPSLFVMLNCILHRIFKPLKLPIVGRLHQFDIFLECSGSLHPPRYGLIGLIKFYYSFFPLLLCWIIRKPFVMCGASIGPFKGSLDRFWARFICNRASLITVRDKISFKLLKDLGVKSPIYLTADLAFLPLRQCSEKRVSEILNAEGICEGERPLVGISASLQTYPVAFPDIKDPEKKYKKYVMLMAKVADYIVEKLDAQVVFVPHSVFYQSRDILVAKDIYQEVINKHRVKLVGESYTPEEIRGVISKCKMFIGCRLHSNIDSTTMGVPTIAIAYDHKYKALSTLLDPEGLIIDAPGSSFNQLLSHLCSKIDYVWENREQIRQSLIKRLPEIVERAWLNAKLIKQLLYMS